MHLEYITVRTKRNSLVDDITGIVETNLRSKNPECIYTVLDALNMGFEVVGAPTLTKLGASYIWHLVKPYSK